MTCCTWYEGWFSGTRSPLWLKYWITVFDMMPCAASAWRIADTWNTPIFLYWSFGSSSVLTSMPLSLR